MIEYLQLLLALITIVVLVIVLVPKNFKIGKRQHQKTALLDSCAVIDGRILELAKAGFVPGNLQVPEFILAELQLLADGNDPHKRERARFGLEVIQQLQQENNINLEINHTKIHANKTDDKLVKLAKQIDADLYTTDYNLNQIASIEGVRVLNVNELAHALRPIALPGESIEVKIIQTGSNKDQGVGYLEDGTMIVVDNARMDIGQKIMVSVNRTHQTVAGKMLFAHKIVERGSTNNRRHRSYNNK